MALLFGRRATVTVGTVRVASEGQDGLRVGFTVSKNLGAEPNACEVTITNLSADTRGKLDSMQELSTEIDKQGLPLTVEAGYEGTVGAIWVGRVRSIDDEKQRTGWVTRIRARDGIGAGRAQIAKALAPGSDLAKALTELVTTIKEKTTIATDAAMAAVKRREFTGPTGALAIFTGGLTLDGSALRKIEQLGEDNGFEVAITDEELVLIQKSKTTAQQAVELSPDSGLVGSPVRVRDEKRPGLLVVKAKALLQPRLHPGGAVHITSAALSGQFKISKLQHRGDTHGADWYTELEAVHL